MVSISLCLVVLALWAASGSATAQTDSPTPTQTPTLRPPSVQEPITVTNADRLVLLAEIQTHEGLVQAVAFSPDGRQIAVGGHDGTVVVVDIQTGLPVTRFEAHSFPVDLLTFTPDGSQLITAGWDKTIRIWNIHQPTVQLAAQLTSDTRIFDLAIHNSLLASAQGDGSIHIWSLASLAEIAILQTSANAAYSVAFSADGSMLAAGTDNSRIVVFETISWTEIQTINSPTHFIRSVLFTAQGEIISTGLPDEFLDERETITQSIDPVVISNQGDWLMLSTGEGLYLWSYPGGENLAQIFDYFSKHDFDAALSPDNQLIAATTSDGTIQLWGIP
jgi:WD40 repeat protein